MAQPSNDHTDKRGDRPSAGQLDSMSTAELLEGMEQALYSMTEETYDAELIDAYLEALERKSPMPEHPTADESYERFRARVGELNAAVNPQSAPARRTRPGPRRALRTALVAVITAACLLSCMVVAQAAGVDVFGSIARWTDNLFGFGDVEDMEATPVPTESSEVTVEYIESLLPVVPDGFVKGEPEIFVDPIDGCISYSVYYSQGNSYISFNAIEQLTSDTSFYQKDEQDVNTIEINGQEIYLFMNNGSPMAAWQLPNLEIGIFTNLAMDDLAHIIITSYGDVLS